MILRRVIHHAKKQEWTAIAIDLVIVVVGVFIGIQVSNWNADRADNIRGVLDAFARDPNLLSELRFWVTNQEVASKVIANNKNAVAAMLKRMDESSMP